MTIDQLIAELQRLKDERKLQGTELVLVELKETPFSKRVVLPFQSIKRNIMVEGAETVILSSVLEGLAIGKTIANFDSTLLFERKCN